MEQPVLAGAISNCGICGSWQLSPLLDMGSQPLAERYGSDERYPLALLECQTCTLVQLSYVADQREVFPQNHLYTSGSTKALREHFMALSQDVTPLLEADDLITDIGTNDGTFLSNFTSRTRQVAVEPTGQAVKCQEKGIPTYQEFFTMDTAKRIREEHGPAKVITACNVLAHTPVPHSFVAGVSHLLADDGVFITENHDVASITDGLQIDTIYHEHLRYYSITSLSRLLGMHGLTVTSAEHIPTHGGSFRIYARKPRRDLRARTKESHDKLHIMLKGITHIDKKRVYGIGATTRATPLIHYTGIAPYITCVCEISSSEKIGSTMPGTYIPVVDESKLIEDQPEYALLFAWHIAETITPKLREAGYKGKFIKPLPVPEVLNG